MCKKIYIAATGQHCGKTTISLSLMHLARQKYKRVGFVKPIGPKCIEYNGMIMDMDAAMMANVYDMDADAHLMSPMTITPGFTKQFLDGLISPIEPRRKIEDAIKELEQKCDFLIIEGAGHSGVGSVVGVSNAMVAAMADALVLLVVNGGIGSVIDEVELNLALYEREKAKVGIVMVNKLKSEKRQDSLSYIKKAFATQNILVTGGFDYNPILAHPTLQHVSEKLGSPLRGDQNEKSRICHTIQLGASSSQRVIDRLVESTLLIVTSSRDELVVTASSLYHIAEFKQKLAGLVVSGHAPMSNITKQILNNSQIPYIRVEETSSELFYRMREHVSKIGPDDLEKIAFINAASSSSIDFEAIDALL